MNLTVGMPFFLYLKSEMSFPPILLAMNKETAVPIGSY